MRTFTNLLFAIPAITLMSACATNPTQTNIRDANPTDSPPIVTDSSTHSTDATASNTDARVSSPDATPRPDAGPIHVLACGQVSSDHWENITPADESSSCAVDSDCPPENCSHCVRGHCDYGDSQAVAVDPHDSGTIYVQMHACNNGGHRPTDGLYGSTDCGATWTKLSTGRNGETTSTGSWVAIRIDPTNTDVMYAAPNYGSNGVWKSTNRGIDWDQTFAPDSIAARDVISHGWFGALSMDPTDPQHLVATPHFSCLPYTPQEYGCISETFDGGATWTTKHSPLNAEGGGVDVINHNIMVFPGGNGATQVSSDDGATWRQLDATGAGGVIQIPDGTYYLGSLNGTLMSTDGLNWSMAPGSHDRNVVLTASDTHVYGADQWRGGYRTAAFDNLSVWTDLTLDGIPPQSQGSPFLAFDVGHHVLISSNFGGGLWRINTP